MDIPRLCKFCYYAEKMPADPNNIGLVAHRCWHGPPSVVAVVVRPGQVQFISQYPLTVDRPCGQWSPKSQEEVAAIQAADAAIAGAKPQ